MEGGTAADWSGGSGRGRVNGSLVGVAIVGGVDDRERERLRSVRIVCLCADSMCDVAQLR